MLKIIKLGLLAGVILFIVSYGGLYLSIKYFPSFFVEYNNPLFNSDGSRDLLFYSHAFVISFSLAWFWERFKSLFIGNFILKGIEFGIIYSLIALLPVMWITFSSMDITLTMVTSWFLYGLLQAIIAGLFFAKVNPYKQPNE
ncbi:MAG TPA: hypothetical protein PLW32_03225 [Chitinophagaceae bacterium]|jgi:hypothetical protein|nr:hypothetical protein [Chitinophagaceae bacterium]